MFPTAKTGPEPEKNPEQLHNLWLSSFKSSANPTDIVDFLLSDSARAQEEDRKLSGQFFPLFYDSGPVLRETLRQIVRGLAARTVVETGIAHGHSTRVFLDELELTGGELFSIDIDMRTLSAVQPHPPHWTPVIIGTEDDVETVFTMAGDIDVFFHDSDHSFGNQMKEYHLAWQHLRPGGVLASDDVSWSPAFRTFCSEVGVPYALLWEPPKVAGFAVKPALGE